MTQADLILMAFAAVRVWCVMIVVMLCAYEFAVLTVEAGKSGN